MRITTISAWSWKWRSSSITGEAASWNPNWEGWAIRVKIRGGLTHDVALTRQCNALLVSYKESDRVELWLA